MAYATQDPLALIGLIEQRIGGSSISALVSMAGRLDTLDLLARALMLDPEPAGPGRRRYLVMGASRVGIDELRAIAREEGFSDSQLEYRCDYNKLDNVSVDRLRGSSYDAVIVGPMHHSVKGMRKSSSAISYMKAHPDVFPPVLDACDANSLKITGSSFRKALRSIRSLHAPLAA